MNMKHYILDADHRAVETDLLTWAYWLEDCPQARIVERTSTGKVRVSTVFLGIDHRFHGAGPPLLFETMVFGGALDGQMWRYSSWDDAVAGHAAAVRKVKKGEALI